MRPKRGTKLFLISLKCFERKVKLRFQMNSAIKKKCGMDGPRAEGRMDGRTDPHIEMC